MKKMTIAMLAALPVVALLSGCATSGNPSVSGANSPSLPPPRDFKRTVVVTTFADGTSSKNGNDDARVHQFEGIYLASRLVEALNQKDVQAYFAPASTPAADYYIHGTIVASDGEKLALKLSLEQCGGTELW